MSRAGRFNITISNEHAGQRIDITLANLLPELSRSGIANLIRSQRIRIESFRVKPSYKLKGGEQVEVYLESPVKSSKPIAQPIALNILHEDQDIIVIDKAAGMVVHPAPGNYENTLVNALLHHFPELNRTGLVERPGIVHRLDKETSGVMVVAKNQFSLNHLAAQFQKRTLIKKYLALVWGVPFKRYGTVTNPIGRHPTDRKKMSIHSRRGRDAMTLWKIKEDFDQMSLLELELKTGRTHQIRVHCATIDHPIVGDPLYGGGGKKSAGILRSVSQDVVAQIRSIRRQMLHAWQLTIVHPRSQATLTFQAPVPSDMETVLKTLTSFRRT